MLPIFALQVISTGETIYEAESSRSMVGWQKLIERKLLKLQNRARRFKEAIQTNDTIVAWENYDIMQQNIPEEDFDMIRKKVFKGYDKYFETRI